MEFHILASGSKGNSTFIYDNGVGILIDCGIARKQLLYKLGNLGFQESNINYHTIIMTIIKILVYLIKESVFAVKDVSKESIAAMKSSHIKVFN